MVARQTEYALPYNRLHPATDSHCPQRAEPLLDVVSTRSFTSLEHGTETIRISLAGRFRQPQTAATLPQESLFRETRAFPPGFRHLRPELLTALLGQVPRVALDLWTGVAFPDSRPVLPEGTRRNSSIFRELFSVFGTTARSRQAVAASTETPQQFASSRPSQRRSSGAGQMCRPHAFTPGLV